MDLVMILPTLQPPALLHPDCDQYDGVQNGNAGEWPLLVVIVGNETKLSKHAKSNFGSARTWSRNPSRQTNKAPQLV